MLGKRGRRPPREGSEDDEAADPGAGAVGAPGGAEEVGDVRRSPPSRPLPSPVPAPPALLIAAAAAEAEPWPEPVPVVGVAAMGMRDRWSGLSAAVWKGVWNLSQGVASGTPVPEAAEVEGVLAAPVPNEKRGVAPLPLAPLPLTPLPRPRPDNREVEPPTPRALAKRLLPVPVEGVVSLTG